MKRIFYIFIAFLMLLNAALPAAAAPSNGGSYKDEVDKITTPNILLYEANTDTVVYEKNGYEKAYPASTTKIMTCIVALENCGSIDRQYSCGWEAQNGFGSKSSLLGLKYGYVVTIKDLLYGLMLCSGNDCGACLAVAVAGSIERFVEMMNEKAVEYGMTGTHYTNPHGLHDDDHYTTAYDMALLMRHALENDTFREIIKTIEYTVVEANGKFTKTIQTSNKFLYTKEGIDWDTTNEYEYAIGGKTGETNVAGYCLVEAAEKDGVTLIAVLMGDPNYDTSKFYYRFHSARTLFDYGFDRYVHYTSQDLVNSFGVTNGFNIQTSNYSPDDPNNGFVTAEVDISSVEITGLREELGHLTAQDFFWHEPELPEGGVSAPVKIGDVIGRAALYYRPQAGGAEQLLFEGDLVATSAVEAAQNAVGETEEPFDIVNRDTGSRRDVCNLNVSKNGGGAEYTVWAYYENTLFTMQDGLIQHYLFLDEDVFRSARVPASDNTVTLYKSIVDESGAEVYAPADHVEAGQSYVIVSQGMALSSVKKGRSLKAVPVTIDERGYISGGVTPDAVWLFTANGNGYQLTSNGLFLHRSGGDGLLFWIFIAILAIALLIIVYLLLTAKKRRHSRSRRGRYKIYR
ncbi:MAG: D-alanyl-D-alanine carboxypeptidase [Clostridia bacterium]|nr:D-alanyl-D-alanine carboxypeptidase [Clostridia bacterium]